MKLLEKKFVDLNCQLLEMGSADFWVEKIMENYLNCDFEDSSDVVYPLNDLIRATGSMEQSNFDEGERVTTSAVSTTKHLIVRDLIIRARPEVLSILLNTSCHRYAAVGVNYLEISVSIEYLLDDRIFDAITRNVFNESDEAQSSAPPPWQIGKSKDFTIENGEWTLREGSKLENITAPLVTNAWFSELIKNESEIEKFLKKQIHPAFWPNSGFADDNVLTKLEALATELTKDKYLEQ
eukprot:gene20676-21357_t